MDTRTLIVSQAVADTMVKTDLMVVDPNYASTSGIRRVGILTGRYPVWVDPFLRDDKVMFTYKADSGNDVPDKSMVDRWRDNPSEENWILLSGNTRGQKARANNTTPSGRTQRAP